MNKIAIIGPESTGKSVLAAALAKHYHADWVPEYARTYVENLDRDYNFDDISQIARQQIAAEQAYADANQNGLVFFDTDLIITKVWFEYCYGQVPDFVLDKLASGFFDLYLLCEPDIPWEADNVREHGNDRDYFYEWYKSEIIQLNKPYRVVNGIGPKRIQTAIKHIDEFLNISNS